MADCEFCGSGVDVEAQDMGDGRVMLLCASCRANIAAGEERDKETMENEATSRYEALGMALPDPEKMCPDECEGTGWMPVKADDPNYAADWAAAEAAAPTDDGWHFVQCHTCGGTGLRVLDANKG